MKIFLLIFSLFVVSSAQNESLRCFYEDVYDMWYLVDYYCVLNIENESGSDDFSSIPGAHPGNLTDSDVSSLYGMAARENSVKIVPSIICRQFNNLRKLWLDDLAIEIVTDKSFAECRNLNELYLGYNKLSSMPQNALWMSTKLRILDLGHNEFVKFNANAFLLLVNLEEIHLDNNKLRFLDSQQFLTNSKLKKINLDGNQLLELSDGLFGSLVNLEVLQVNSNNLRVLTSKSFNSNLNNLIELQAAFNQISAVDLKIFDHLPTLKLASFDKNSCVDKTYEDFNLNRVENLKEFDACGFNYESSKIECLYASFFYTDGPIYTCLADIYNPYTRDDFDEIHGTHSRSRSNSNVQIVFGESSRSENVKIAPLIICEKFENLADLYLDGLGIEIVTEKSFKACKNLESLYLSYNEISEIPENTFDENLDLKFLDLGSNKIEKLSLKLENLEHFYIDHNPIEFHEEFFDKMGKLKALWLGSTNINEVKSRWLLNLVNLEEIYLQDNKITQLSPSTFEKQANLKKLQLSFNHVATLHADSIPKTLVELHFGHNQIKEIQRKIFDSMDELNLVAFEGNLCVDDKFEDFQNGKSENLGKFEKCFESYSGSANENVGSKILVVLMIFIGFFSF